MPFDHSIGQFVPEDPKAAAPMNAQLMTPGSVDLIAALDCPVCLEIMERPVTLACGHHGCQPCLVGAVMISKCCPVCRKKTTVKYVKGLCVSIFIQDMAAPHLKERRRLDVELKKELERKQAAEDQQVRAAVEAMTSAGFELAVGRFL